MWRVSFKFLLKFSLYIDNSEFSLALDFNKELIIKKVFKTTTIYKGTLQGLSLEDILGFIYTDDNFFLKF